MTKTLETSVIVVGGSLVGLSTALFLAHWNVPVILLERHTSSSLHPRAVGYTARTIELLDTVGAAEKISGIQWSGGPPKRIVVESLAGKWAKEQVWSKADADKDHESAGSKKASPPSSNFKQYSHVEGIAIAQDKIEPVLRARALELGADLRLGFTVTDWSQDDNGVTITATNGEDGAQITVKGKYLVACDGGRSPIREKLGIKRHGVGFIRSLRSILFRCQPMQKYLELGYQQFQIERREDGFEAFLTTYGDGRWMLAWNEQEENAPVPSEQAQKGQIRKASGLDLADNEISLITTMKWDIGGLIADSFNSGRVFLAGDAAHSLPPNRGGYGANTGIADAHNLAWKLAAVLSGESQPELLNTYDEERRPVADVRHDQVFAREDHRRAIGDREWPGKYVEVLDDAAIEFGQIIRSSSVILSSEEDFPPAKKPDEWAGQPGTRAPHVALIKDGKPVSTLNFFGRSWVVISKDLAWKSITAQSSKINGISVDFVLVGGEGLVEETEGTFSQLFGLEPQGAALIRPDGYIAWKSFEPLENAQEGLNKALKQVAKSTSAA